MAHPTRPDPIPLMDRNHLVCNTFQVTLVPQIPPEEKDTFPVNMRDIIDLFSSDYSLEGILHVDTPENPTTVFYVVFSGYPDTEENKERIRKFSKDITFNFDETPDPTQHKKVTFKVEMVSLSTLEETKRHLFDWVWTQLMDALTLGKASAYGVTWEAMPNHWYSSTPKEPDFSRLVSEMQRQGDSVLLNFYQTIKRECDNRHLIPGSIPVPGESFVDTEKLGEAIAKSNQDFLTALTSRWIVKSSPPKLHPFSDEKHKEDVTFEQWSYEVRQYLKTHTEESVKEAMIQCLKGATLEGVRNLGEDSSVTEILEHLKCTFQGAAPFDTLLKNFFSLEQGEHEDVAKFAIRLESQLASIKWQYPEELAPQTESKYKRDRLFFGLHKNIKDSVRQTYKDSKVSYAELLRAAREIEEELKPSNPTECMPEKKKNGKAKVASAQVGPGLDNDGNLERLAKAAAACQQQQETAQKLINELVKTLSDLRSPNYHFNPSGQDNSCRGRGGRGGWRDRGGRGRGNGHTNGSGQGQASAKQPAVASRGGQHDQPQGATGGGNGQARTPRQPFCFYCKNQGSDQYNHWPNRCELLGSVISGYHQEQAKIGHTDNKGNNSEHS